MFSGVAQSCQQGSDTCQDLSPASLGSIRTVCFSSQPTMSNSAPYILYYSLNNCLSGQYQRFYNALQGVCAPLSSTQSAIIQCNPSPTLITYDQSPTCQGTGVSSGSTQQCGNNVTQLPFGTCQTTGTPSGLSSGAIVGIVVGCVVGAVVLTMVIFLLIVKRR